MKNYFIAFCLLALTVSFGQNKGQQKVTGPFFLNQENRKIEDEHGNLVTDPAKRKLFFEKQQRYLDLDKKRSLRSPQVLTPVPLCTNGTFEEFETIAGINYLTNYEYTYGDPLNPMQCQLINAQANTKIKQYNPADVGLMTSTVPSNYIDEFIGNINAFDQYTLKINYKESSPSLALVQAKRYKTSAYITTQPLI